jgi:pimeloyl-ACP methyl ester carboxylesterase
MNKKLYFIFIKTIGFCLNILSYFLPEQTAKIAYQIFSRPRKRKLKEKEMPFVLKKSKHLRLGDIQCYIWEGSEKTVLLVHGWESNSSRWNRFLKHLKMQGYNVVAIDAPAHGLSGCLDFNAIKYASFIEVAIKEFNPHYIIGHSVGAMATIYNQFKNPDNNVEKIVSLGTPSDFRFIFNNYISMFSYNKRVVDSLEQYYVENFNLKIDDFSCALFAKNIKIPGFIAHDIADKIIPISESKKIHKNWQNSMYFETNGLGHSLQNMALFEKIIDFLSE